MARRFNVLGQMQDWGGIVEMWETDMKRKGTRKGRLRKDNKDSEADKNAKLRREVVGLINAGKISKAMQRITSHGVASIEDPAVLDMLKSKYPERGRAMPDRVTKGQCVDNLSGLRESLLRLEPGVAAGTGGMKAEYLIVLAKQMEEEDMELLQSFGMKYLSGELPNWFYPVWLTVQTVPLFKSSQQNTLRPVGVRNPLLKVWHREVITQNKEDLKQFLEPQQLACSEAGAAKLVTCIRTLIEAKPEIIVIKLDLKNAFNENARRAIIDTLESEPSLRHLAWFAAITLAPYSGLETGGTLWGESGEGTVQGAPESAPWFCAAIQPAVE